MEKKILIVDDEPDILEVTIPRLKKSGYTVLTTTTSEEALDLVPKNMPDLILLDMLLPKMQGDELCKWLKKEDKFKHIPIIIFTASIVRIPEKVNEMGADDYILKPFDAKELLRKIRKFIG